MGLSFGKHLMGHGDPLSDAGSIRGTYPIVGYLRVGVYANAALYPTLFALRSSLVMSVVEGSVQWP